MRQACVRLSVSNVCIVVKRCVLEQKVTIDSLYKVVYEKLIGTKMNDLDFCLEVVSRSCQPLNISETARDRGLVPKVHR